ncbi:N-formylglutamate deformylase [Sphingobium sp. CAP-1]|uniref:N-formylglutamate deformylase n=1 Tax=Sphingobium sp. CAP-1 TaxID=2676077 RepID=UPI0012BB45CC|nr:N-formylglutamate deformylase [Sphingobium sp. CAP-1]QGP78043.1 N-formylglutamate deformylase [Sphingobium sp. CAP-1]
MTNWLSVQRGDAPLILTFPHVGADLADVAGDFRSDWLARRDADWWVDDLYAFAGEMGATMIRTAISRSVIDLNRDPSGASLYPGQATTELCPTTTFDGDPLYAGAHPDAAEIARRRANWFDPYHAALAAEIARLRARHPHIVLYDAHSIRSHVPRLFDGELPQFNIGTNGGASCDPALEAAVATLCAASGHSHVVNGRFRGGWTTRHHGRPDRGVHAIQMELAMRGYLTEPARPDPANWPAPIHPDPAILPTLRRVIAACIDFAKGRS